MTMYREQYAMCIMTDDGKVQKETDGAVTLPFGTEYQVRLRNKSRVRSIADICIDGETVVKGVIIDADGKVDVERYLEGHSLTNGPRFKLARLSDPKVSQPGESQNGLLEVRFYQEKPAPKVEVTEHVHNHYGGTCRCANWPHRPWGFSNVCRSGLPIGGQSLSKSTEGRLVPDSMASFTSSADTKSLSLGTAMADISPIADQESIVATNGAAEAAATVEGGMSRQSFQSVSIEIDRDSCVTLILKLLGMNRVVSTCKCGRNRKDESFCPSCGYQLVN